MDRKCDALFAFDNIINTAKEEAEKIGWALGHEQGLAKGLAEGRAKAFVEMAQKMLAAGLPVEKISQLTGLSAEDFRQNPILLSYYRATFKSSRLIPGTTQ